MRTLPTKNSDMLKELLERLACGENIALLLARRIVRDPDMVAELDMRPSELREVEDRLWPADYAMREDGLDT